jgi:hypothetical protein
VLKTGLNVESVDVEGLTPIEGLTDQLSNPAASDVKLAVLPAHKVGGEANKAFIVPTYTVIVGLRMPQLH